MIQYINCTVKRDGLLFTIYTKFQAPPYYYPIQITHTIKLLNYYLITTLSVPFNLSYLKAYSTNNDCLYRRELT
ncbi:hypothetical protein BCACH14_27070 [Bacillus cereus]|nr:hypothetical protein BCACH14_27070 [Bacillus cereus]